MTALLQVLNASTLVAWLLLMCLLGREALGGSRKVRSRVLDALLALLTLSYLLARTLILLAG